MKTLQPLTVFTILVTHSISLGYLYENVVEDSSLFEQERSFELLQKLTTDPNSRNNNHEYDYTNNIDSSSSLSIEEAEAACHTVTDCKECYNLSYRCHWCSADDACHAKGSIHGCIRGVNCYNNERCQRKEPEFVATPIIPRSLSWGAIFVVMFVALASLGFVTCLFCCAGVFRDMSQNLYILRAVNEHQQQRSTDDDNNRNRQVSSSASITLPEDDLSEPLITEKKQGFKYNYRVCDEEEIDNVPKSNKKSPEDDDMDLNSLLSSADEVLATDLKKYGKRKDRGSAYTTSSSRGMKFVYNCCKAWYFITSGLIVLIALGFVVFYPVHPVYNVCSNQLDWKSIVDGMTSLKAQATFQVLISIYNPNKLDVNLNMGYGIFKHDGIQVGTFEIPPATAKAMSISDYLVNLTLTPDEWEALELTSEYYKGTLTFQVDAEAEIEIPDLGNLTYDAKFNDYFIHVGEQKGRELCNCQM